VNLRQAIASGSLQAKDALAIVPQICDALQFAHNEGIVHRDIKPENILIDKKGRVKIADFGLAKLLGQDHSPDSLTATHQVMGTIRYMAPEQMEGSREIDHRADIYSLGVVFYEMLTGELPLGRFAPPSERVQIDVRLDEVVLRSLAKEPQRRYQQANDVKTDLDNISHSPPPAAPPKVALPPQGAANFPMEPDFEEARDQVRGPAIGLVVTGIIHCAFFPILLIVFLGYMVVEVRPAPQAFEIHEHLEAEPSGRSFERVTEPKPEGSHD
jgi:serine/threonine protein kinase